MSIGKAPSPNESENAEQDGDLAKYCSTADAKAISALHTQRRSPVGVVEIEVVRAGRGSNPETECQLERLLRMDESANAEQDEGDFAKGLFDGGCQSHLSPPRVPRIRFPSSRSQACPPRDR